MLNIIKTESATWPLGKLKVHPQQQELFPDMAPEELDELKEDIRARGLQHPIEVLPDGTVNAGHQRLRAVRKLKWKTVPVLIRHDLAAQGEAAVEGHLIGDNVFRRRQLPALVLARCYQRLKENRAGRASGKLCDSDRGDLRDQIAKRLGCSGRSLDRWLRILRLPRPIQRAVEDDSMSQRQAIRVAGLPEDVQQEIAEALARGTPVREVLAQYLPRGPVRHRNPHEALDAFTRALEGGLHDLGDRVDGLDGITRTAVDVLVRGREMIGRLLTSVRRL